MGTSTFEAVKAWETAETASLHIEVRGCRVDIWLPDGEKPLISFEDAKPLTHGMWGFFSTGKELSVLECTVAPLE